MGNNSYQHPQFYPVEHNQHPHLGSLVLIAKQDLKLWLKQYNCIDQYYMEQMLRRMNTRMKKFIHNEYLLNISHIEYCQKQEMCVNNWIIKIYLQPSTNNLSNIIAQKLNQRQNFQQQEIFQLIKLTIDALIYAQDNGLKNTQLDIYSILIHSQKIKIIDSLLVNQHSYHKLLIYLMNSEKQQSQEFVDLYLAPQLLKELKQGHYQPYFSPKSDIFSLGMIVMSMACLEKMNSYYKYKDYNIDYASLIHRVSKIIYSLQLKTIIARMLQWNSNQRIGLISLQQTINQQLNRQNNNNNNNINKIINRSSSTKMLKQLLTNSRKTNFSQKSIHFPPNNTRSISLKSSNQKINCINQYQTSKQDQINTFRYTNIKQNKMEFNKNSSHLKLKKSIHIQQQQIQFDIKNKVKERMNKNKTPLSLKININHDNYSSSIRTLHSVKYNKLTQANKENQEVQRKKQLTFRSNACYNQLIPINGQNFQQKALSIQESFQKQQIENRQQNRQELNTQKTKRMPIKSQSSQKYNEDEYISGAECVSKHIKSTLQKMYKTTLSINSSGGKSDYSKILAYSANQYHKLQLNNNTTYEGQFNSEGLMQGNGILYAADGRIIYSGCWKDGLFSGFGSFFNLQVCNNTADYQNLEKSISCQLKYEGQFQQGMRNGFGTIYYALGERFSGTLKKGLIDGYGNFHSLSGKIISGIWKNNFFVHN